MKRTAVPTSGGQTPLTLLASVQGLPFALQVMHAITGMWVIGWLGMAVRGGTHLRDD